MEQQNRQIKFNNEMMTMRKVQNADAEKCVIFQTLIKELRMDLKRKDVIILKLKLALDSANSLLNVENTDKFARENVQLKEQTIEDSKVIMKLKAEVLALHEKVKNLDLRNSILPSEANFESEFANNDKNLDIVKSVPENRCKYVERFRFDGMKIDDRGTTTHIVVDINNDADLEQAPDANFSPPHYPEYHSPAARSKKTSQLCNERQLIPSPEQEEIVPQTIGAVLVVYGLDEDTSNTDKVFNLVCLYGNVARIRIIKGKRTAALVQMADYAGAERCIKAIRNTPIGKNGRITTELSTKAYLSEQIHPYTLPDRTPGYKNYTASEKNRFLKPCRELAGDNIKNQFMSPTKFLFFWNTPCGIKESDLMKLFNSQGCKPNVVSMFTQEPEQSSSGVIEFSNEAYAVLAIMTCNHMPIESKGFKVPFIMKLRFSSE